nr:unnamed protein product [Digitaria exilis]
MHRPALHRLRDTFLHPAVLAADLLPTLAVTVRKAFFGGLLEHRPPSFHRSGRACGPVRKGAAPMAPFRGEWSPRCALKRRRRGKQRRLVVELLGNLFWLGSGADGAWREGVVYLVEVQ